jgi:hypothetical protein
MVLSRLFCRSMAWEKVKSHFDERHERGCDQQVIRDTGSFGGLKEREETC